MTSKYLMYFLNTVYKLINAPQSVNSRPLIVAVSPVSLWSHSIDVLQGKKIIWYLNSHALSPQCEEVLSPGRLFNVCTTVSSPSATMPIVPHPIYHSAHHSNPYHTITKVSASHSKGNTMPHLPYHPPLKAPATTFLHTTPSFAPLLKFSKTNTMHRLLNHLCPKAPATTYLHTAPTSPPLLNSISHSKTNNMHPLPPHPPPPKAPATTFLFTIPSPPKPPKHASSAKPSPRRPPRPPPFPHPHLQAPTPPPEVPLSPPTNAPHPHMSRLRLPERALQSPDGSSAVLARVSAVHSFVPAAREAREEGCRQFDGVSCAVRRGRK